LDKKEEECELTGAFSHGKLHNINEPCHSQWGFNEFLGLSGHPQHVAGSNQKMIKVYDKQVFDHTCHGVLDSSLTEQEQR
jgi:hypothetical protein